MSMDIRENHDIGKLPENIKQGLHKLEEILKLPSTPHLHKLQMQIIDENIFYFPDAGNGSKHIGTVEELMLVRSIAQYLAQVVDPGSRNSLFITLFPVGSTEPLNNLKSRLLTALVSLAVSTHNVAVLDSTAVWMQQVSCLSAKSCRMCYGLIQDYFHANSESPPHFGKALKALASATPLFTANLITSLAQVYAKIGNKELCDEPPESLVEIVVHWLRTHPLLALTPLTTTIPGISLPMIAVLPIAPLAKWCVDAPFFNQSQLRNPDYQKLYSELHLLLLQTLRAVTSINSQLAQLEVIRAEHLKDIAESLCVRINDERIPEAPKVIAFNRLAQIVLVALRSKCLIGRTGDMWTALYKVPGNQRLMKILRSSSTSSR